MKKKNVLSAILAILMLISMMSGFVLPATAAESTVYTYGDWQYTLSEGMATIVGYTGTDTIVNIPKFVYNEDTGEDFGVWFIGARAFYENTTITDLYLNTYIESIGDYAFYGCTNLKLVDYWLEPEEEASGPYTIGASAFANCGKLTSFTVGMSTESVGESAFLNCTSLTTVSAANALGWTVIEPHTFSGCTALSTVSLPESMEEIGELAFYQCKALKSINLQQRVRVIGNNAFERSGLTSFTSSEQIQSIGDYAFYSCSNMTSASIYAGTVGEYAFGKCIYLTSVGLGSVTSLGKSAFRDCYRLPTVNIPDTVKSIGEYAFNGCAALTAVYLPEGEMSTIAPYTFRNCTSLAFIEVPQNIKTVGAGAFTGCSALTEAVVYNKSGVPSGAFPTETTIRTHPFNFTVDGTTATLTKYIGTGKTVRIPATVVQDGNIYNVTALGDELFLDKSDRIIAVEIPEGIQTIGNDAFRDMDLITAITLPESLISIGDYAFNSCGKLTAVRIPAAVRSIGKYAFNNCGSLTRTYFCEGLETIAAGAFYYCNKLNNVCIPKSVDTIGTNAFASCSALKNVQLLSASTVYESTAFPEAATVTVAPAAFEFTVTDGLATITAYNGCDTDVTVPAEVSDANGTYPVVTIGEKAFYQKGSLQSVTLPDSVKTIETYAFYGCVGLQEINLSKNLVTIGDSAFRSLPLLKHFEMPHSLTALGDLVLMDSGVETVTVSTGLTALPRNGFYNCQKLRYINIPGNIETIGSYCFYRCSSLANLTIEKGLKYIEYDAFRGCTSLNVVTIPSTIDSIGSSTFAECTSMQTITIYNKNASWGGDAFPANAEVIWLDASEEPDPYEDWEYTVADGTVTITGYLGSDTAVKVPDSIDGSPVTVLGHEVFKDNTTLKSVSLPASLVTIDSYVFSGCTALTAITIPESVTSIGGYAFYGCHGLTEIEIPNSVTSLGSYAFSNCTNLYDIILPEGLTDVGFYVFLATAYANNEANWKDGALYLGEYLLDAKLTITSCTVQEGTTLIAPDAFYNCSVLTSVIIPDSVTHIGAAAFFDCTALTEMILPASVTAVGQDAFTGCTNLATAYVLNKNAELGENAFPDTTTILYALPTEEAEFTTTVSDGKVTIGKYEGTETEVIIPETVTVDGEEYPVTVISSAAFQNNKTLTKVTFPETLEQIGSFAFSGCTGLTQVTIPASVTNIGRYAFNGCSALTSVTYQGANTLLGSYAMPTAATATYWWSATALDGAATVTGYTGTETEVTVPGEVVVDNVRYPVTQVGESAFKQNTAITGAVISEGVVTINPNAFHSCENLTSVKFPSTLKNIYSAAFQGCTNLAAVKFPEGLEYIGSVAFNSCRSLTEVTIPQSVTSIGRYAFWVCNKLETVTIYNSAITLGDSAFPTTTNVVYKEGIDTSVPHLKLDTSNTNLAILNTIDLTVSRVYWGYAGSEEIETQDWNTFASAVPSSSRVSDYNPTEGEVYAMVDSGYYLFWINYTDAEGNAQSTCQTVYAEGTLDENYGKPYLELDETGKVAWMNLNGTTVQKMYWGFIGDTDYKYTTWDEFCTRVRNNSSYLPDYGVKDGEGYVVNETGYYRFVIVYLDAQGVRQERYFTIEATTPATAPSMDNSTLSNVVSFVNEEGYTSKVYYGYIGTENTKYVDFNTFKATATDFVTDFGTQAGKTFQLTKAGYWRFVINYTVNGASKDAICTVYVDEADLSLGTPKLTQSGNTVTLDANGSTVSKIYIGYMGTEAVEIDSWADYTANRQTNTVTYGPKDGTAFTLGTAAGYYTVVVSYNTGGADQLAFYTFQV